MTRVVTKSLWLTSIQDPVLRFVAFITIAVGPLPSEGGTEEIGIRIKRGRTREEKIERKRKRQKKY